MISGYRAPAANLRGWIVVAVSFGAPSPAFSARSTLGLAMPLWERDLGWSRGLASLGGVLYDLFARYEEIWIASVILAALAGVMALTIREGKREGVQPDANPA